MAFAGNGSGAESWGRVLSDFRLEWIAAGIVAAVDAVWAIHAGFSVSATAVEIAVPATAFTAAIVMRTRFVIPQGALVAEFFALTTVTTAFFGVLSYLCCTANYPLIDGTLEHADRALGFDWLAGYRLLTANHVIAKVLALSYDSLVYQGLYFGVLYGLMRQRQRLREMFWIVFVSGLLTSGVSVWFPALGTFKTFGMANHADYIPVIEHLRTGLHHVALGQMTGVVSFPSFHTTMALAYIYGFRRTGAISLLALALNLIMLIAIPFCGGHYLTDMIAGAAVAGLSIAAARGLLALGRTRPKDIWEAAAQGFPV